MDAAKARDHDRYVVTQMGKPHKFLISTRTHWESLKARATNSGHSSISSGY